MTNICLELLPGEAITLELGQKSVYLTVVPGGSYDGASIGRNVPADWPILLIGGKCIHASQTLKSYFS